MEDGPGNKSGRDAPSAEVIGSILGKDPPSTPFKLLKREEFSNDPLSIHRLEEVDGDRIHIWTVEDGSGYEVPIPGIDRTTMEKLLTAYTKALTEGKPAGDMNFRSFGNWDDDWREELEGGEGRSSMSVVRDGEVLDLRYRGSGYQYDLQYLVHPRSESLGPYLMSRLTHLGFDGVPTLLGVSYWDLEGDLYPWSCLIRYPKTPRSGFSPFLSDLRELIISFRKMTPEQSLGYLFGLSTSLERTSFESAFQLGVSIGELQGYMISREDQGTKGGKHTFGDRIMERFTGARFRSSDLGEILGHASTYIDGVKRSLRRVSGSMNGGRPLSGRKLKVLKGESMIKKGIGPEEARLSLLNGYLVRKERSIRGGIMGLRSFVGSPSISSCVDCNLERLSLLDTNWFMFHDMDWKFHLDDQGSDRKMLPLKYLAQVLNSLMKARYLSARHIFSEFSRRTGIERELLDTLFLEYNLKKPGYRNMMADIRIHQRIGKDVPFRVIFDVSIISKLWYDRCHNALVEGYNHGVSMYDNRFLVDYPRKTKTADGIRIMQALLSLSDLSRTLEEGGQSQVSIESDLLILLTRW